MIKGALYFSEENARFIRKENDQTKGDGRPIKDYIWVNATPIAQIKVRKTKQGTLKQKQLLCLHTDHLNTPRLATNTDQTVVSRWAGDAFGQTKPDKDPDGDGNKANVRLRFPGQYHDGESGLYYNWSRYYDPKTGRYVTSDPIGVRGGLNIYTYVGNSPLHSFDPIGLIPPDWWKDKPQPPARGPFGPICGSGATATYIPDGYFTANFVSACKRHDNCYATCGSSKALCDIRLLLDLKRACGGIVNFTCMAVARLYVEAIERFGDKPYREAQEQACKSCGE